MSRTITSFTAINVTDFHGFVETGLKRFRNVDFTVSELSRRHGAARNQSSNVRKQAKHIAYCLNLGQEYLKSARGASLSIKPVLIYYSLVNFALAEVLMKQNGNSSLDRSREQNAHHGLEIAFPSNISKISTFIELANGLRAKPHIKSGNRTGTFNLWHRTSREHPVVGKIAEKSGVTGYDTVLVASDAGLPLVSASGLSFFDCIQLLPSFDTNIRRLGFHSHYARGHVHIDKKSRDDPVLLFTLHPAESPLVEGVAGEIKLSPSAIEDFDYQQFESGFGFRFALSNPAIRHIHLPMISSLSVEEIRICSIDSPLNEFGAFFYAFFILGNLCRYYPDLWLPHLDSHSDMILLVESLCEEFFLRVPTLVLGELGGTLYLQRKP